MFDIFAWDLFFLKISNIDKPILQQRDTQTKSYSYTVLYGDGIRLMLHSYYTEVINRIGKTPSLLIQLKRTEWGKLHSRIFSIQVNIAFQHTMISLGSLDQEKKSQVLLRQNIIFNTIISKYYKFSQNIFPFPLLKLLYIYLIF